MGVQNYQHTDFRKGAKAKMLVAVSINGMGVQNYQLTNFRRGAKAKNIKLLMRRTFNKFCRDII